MNVRVVVASTAEAHLLELADRLRRGLADLGLEAPDGAAGRGVVELVVAPHRAYEALRAEQGRGAVLRAARGRVHLVTTPPGEPGFALDAEAAAMGRGALVLSPEAGRALERKGVRAACLPTAWDPGLAPPEPPGPRPVDVVFFGTLTPRRERLLAALSEALPGRRLEILARDAHEPLVREQAGHVWGEARAAYLARTRVVLDLAPDDTPSASWLRWAAAAHAGAVVVAERGCEVPGEHAVLAEPAQLAATIEALLADPSRCEAIAASARAALQARGTVAERLVELLGAVRPGLPGPRLLAARARLEARAGLDQGWARARAWAERHLSRALLPASKAHLDSLLYESRLEWDTLYRRQQLTERSLGRRLDALAVQLTHGAAEPVTGADSLAVAAHAPDVSVVVTAYNYGAVLDEALDSVFASRGVRPEVIVVDDASRDDTAARLAARLAARPDQPLRVLTHRSNRGLAAARNTGFAAARAPLVFVLDADNRVVPEALAALVEALHGAPEAAFAYGVLRRFGTGAPGLVSAYPWRLPQLIRHNVIDAMALVRRDAWAAVGGYRPDMDAEFGGMEDWALWLAFAERGWHGVLVPRVLAEYRVHAAAMTGTMLQNYRLTDRILARFPGLAEAVAATPRPGRPVAG
ncbi:MAG: glycosyltransferase family 2 protein [Candidatus Sericytochromatia bacterium]|nr:glycosyltransferase family 2 protein [Candidatus Sericytochromatia bacterium]